MMGVRISWFPFDPSVQYPMSSKRIITMFGLAVVFWETVIIVSYLERWHLDVVSVLDASRQKVFGRGFD